MTAALADLLSPAVSAVVVGLISWIAIRVSVARLEEKANGFEKQLSKIEAAVGLGNPDEASFIGRREGQEMIKGLRDIIRELVTRQDRMEGRMLEFERKR